MHRPQITAMLAAIFALAALGGCSRDSTGPWPIARASLTLSTIAARATRLTANGLDTTTITVTPRDANGVPVRLASGAVLITADQGSLSDVQQNADGTFAALLTAPVMIGEDMIAATVNGQNLHQSLLLTLVPGPPSAAASELGASSLTILADGKDTTDVFVVTRDAHGNEISGVVVTMTTTKGTLSPVVAVPYAWDYGDDGRYVAKLTSTTTVDSAMVQVQIAGQPFGAPIVVHFVLHQLAVSTCEYTAYAVPVTSSQRALDSVGASIAAAGGLCDASTRRSDELAPARSI